MNLQKNLLESLDERIRAVAKEMIEEEFGRRASPRNKDSPSGSSWFKAQGVAQPNRFNDEGRGED